MKKEDLQEMLGKFSSKKVIIIGDYYVDEYVYTESEKLSPEASVPRAVVKTIECMPGAAGNVANMFTALGAKVVPLGIIGDDSAGQMLLNHFRAKGAETSSFVVDTARVTGKLSRVLLKGPSGFQHVIRVDHENQKAISDATKARVVDILKHEIKDADAIFVADYDEIGTGLIKQDILKIITQEAAKNNVMTIGISRGRIGNMEGFDVLIGNALEVEMATGKKISNEEELEKEVIAFKQKMQNKTFIATRAEKGLIAFDAANSKVELPTLAEEVVDVCGAGDALSSACTLALLAGAHTEQAAMIGSAAAAAAVAKPGTATVSPNEIQSVLLSERSGATPLEELAVIVANTKAQGKKVVFANGYFDFIHGGHVGFLKAAKRLGDILVVAVNSDESTRLNKGADHPLIGEKERAKVLASFDFVDHVTIFNDMTPLKAIKQIQPDVLVKGGNFTESQVVGGDIVKSYGGKVQVIPLQGPATSKIIEQIRSAKKSIHE